MFGRLPPGQRRIGRPTFVEMLSSWRRDCRQSRAGIKPFAFAVAMCDKLARVSTVVPSGKHWLAPLALLVLIGAINFAAMPAIWYAGDPTAWREETRSILRDKALHVDAEIAKQSGDYGQYFAFNPQNGLWYCKYGVMNSVMALPPMALDSLLKGRVPRPGEESLLIFNLYNILLSLLTCALL